MACFPAAQSAMYSASVVEVATQRCFLLDQDTAPLANRKVLPDVDFLLSGSPAKSYQNSSRAGYRRCNLSFA